MLKCSVKEKKEELPHIHSSLSGIPTPIRPPHYLPHVLPYSGNPLCNLICQSFSQICSVTLFHPQGVPQYASPICENHKRDTFQKSWHFKIPYRSFLKVYLISIKRIYYNVIRIITAPKSCNFLNIRNIAHFGGTPT